MSDSSEKRVVIKLQEKSHADFKIRLSYDELTQTAFFRAITEGYIEQNDLIIRFLEEYKKRGGLSSEYKRKRREQDRRERADNLRRFSLGEEEIEDIYDLVEKEYPDL